MVLRIKRPMVDGYRFRHDDRYTSDGNDEALNVGKAPNGMIKLLYNVGNFINGDDRM